MAKSKLATGMPVQPKELHKSPRVNPPTGGLKKPPRFRPGEIAQREIKRYQKRTALLLPQEQMQRAITAGVRSLDSKLRVSDEAVLALQYAAEDYLGRIMQTANNLATEKSRETILLKDLGRACVKEQQRIEDKQKELQAQREKIEAEYRSNIEEEEMQVEHWEWNDEYHSSSDEEDAFDTSLVEKDSSVSDLDEILSLDSDGSEEAEKWRV